MLRMVTLEHGQVQGLSAADPLITSFKGFPFAAPPVGENRWRAPQPQTNWTGTLKAFDFAPTSMQAKTVIDDNNIYTREWAVDPDLPMDEDCLYLNVWTPAKRTITEGRFRTDAYISSGAVFQEAECTCRLRHEACLFIMYVWAMLTHGSFYRKAQVAITLELKI
ncbi:carboxylesterase family protein [Paenibacillus pabuli]|uniref:carboxylesterase family protein n=1 Tax=Paenibacillus pabuli TaxID=1472 RepID=UPI0032B44F97